MARQCGIAPLPLVLLRRILMSGQGSAGNIIAALCSFFIPGLGQLLQGRLFMAIFQFCLAAVLWFFLLGWVIPLWSIFTAAHFKPSSYKEDGDVDQIQLQALRQQIATSKTGRSA